MTTTTLSPRTRLIASAAGANMIVAVAGTRMVAMIAPGLAATTFPSRSPAS
jgi:hypothetical protein